ncbi:hypothetical protein DFH09DRAFT_1315571 [Mycena vulgaris]|nr:hypothetical protein DFH09DRAFT_1315571 [Mycena vulgaris]
MFSLRALLSTALSPVRASAGTRPVLRANLSSTPARSAAFGALWRAQKLRRDGPPLLRVHEATRVLPLRLDGPPLRRVLATPDRPSRIL